MMDNDCDGLVDCQDPDCAAIFPCKKASKDPTILLYGRNGGLGRLKGHAKLTMATVDLHQFPVGVLLSDTHGALYSDGLPAGKLDPDATGRNFRFRNPAARTTGGMAEVKIKNNGNGTFTFSFTSYGDTSPANDHDTAKRLQFYIGTDPNAAADGRIFITTNKPWTEKPGLGWRAPKDH
jgi:hypothetical protein